MRTLRIGSDVMVFETQEEAEDARECIASNGWGLASVQEWEAGVYYVQASRDGVLLLRKDGIIR